MSIVNFETPRSEVYRYLGYGKNTPEQNVIDEVEACINELEKAATPRSIYEKFPVEAEPDGSDTILHIAGMEIRSKNLARNLKGCGEVYLIAVTIGPGPDMLVKRAELTKVSRSIIYQAAGAAMVEAWCDIVNKMIIDEAKKNGLFARPRFSPGYGDVPLELQKDFSRVLNMPKNIGVSLLESLLMTPSKSVTAFIGVSDKEIPCIIQGCEECQAASTCIYRR